MKWICCLNLIPELNLLLDSSLIPELNWLFDPNVGLELNLLFDPSLVNYNLVWYLNLIRTTFVFLKYSCAWDMLIIFFKYRCSWNRYSYICFVIHFPDTILTDITAVLKHKYHEENPVDTFTCNGPYVFSPSLWWGLFITCM